MKSTIILVVVLASLAAAIAIASAGIGYRLGLWELMTALGILRTPWLVVAALVGAAASAVAFLVVLFSGPRGLAVPALVAAVAAGLAGYAPLAMKQQAESAPFMHDVTTDFDDPPRIIAGAAEPRRNPPEYLGDRPVRDGDAPVAVLQQKHYPDIAPLLWQVPVEQVADAARAALARMRIDILDERALDDGGVEIEGVATTLWFGFKDDFVVRITPRDDGSRIDVRSKSRVGGSDLGANAERVRRFVELLRQG